MSFQAWLLRVHRWVALAFALPLVVVLLTGLVLSFEPWMVTRAIVPGALTVERVEALIKQHDAEGRATAVARRSYDGTISIGGRRGGTVVDIASGQALPGPTGIANFMTTNRRLHETLLLDLSSLVIASTVAMLVLIVLGVLMGLPRVANTLSGWHKGMAWVALPLVILSPLTGLFLGLGVSFTSPPAGVGQGGGQGGGEKPPALVEALRIAAKSHDISSLVWLRPQGNRMLLRVVEGGEFRVYNVTRSGTTAMPRNWPRLLHEGNFAGGWSALLNIVTSFVLIGLLSTGALIWARRELRRLRNRRAREAATAATA